MKPVWGDILMLTVLGGVCGCRSLPPGLNVSGSRAPVAPSGVRLLIDSTAWDPDTQERVIRQVICDGLL